MQLCIFQFSHFFRQLSLGPTLQRNQMFCVASQAFLGAGRPWLSANMWVILPETLGGAGYLVVVVEAFF